MPRIPPPPPRSSSTLSLRRLSSSFMARTFYCLPYQLIRAVQRFLQAPTSVGPQPIRGTLEHVDFAGTRIALGDPIGLHRLPAIPQHMQHALIVPPPHSAH